MITGIVGKGVTRGPLSIFPVWGEHVSRRGYTSHLENLTVTEVADGPQVGSLVVGNLGNKPLLLLQGQILVGGLQNRMVARSVLIQVNAQVSVDVVCVEAGRWAGQLEHKVDNQRGSTRVRSALSSAAGVQSTVWNRVAEFDQRVGANATSSYTEHADRAQEWVRELVDGLRPFPGQVGIVIGLSGQPVVAEIMDSPRTLAEQFDSIVQAAALDALWLPPIVTPARRARRFLDRAALVHADATTPAGLAVGVSGRSQHVEVSSLAWRSRNVHTVVTNLRHELVAA